jgi:hypothetical protein
MCTGKVRAAKQYDARAACDKQYRLRMDEFNEEAGALGCKGVSVFERLPYYRCIMPRSLTML